MKERRLKLRQMTCPRPHNYFMRRTQQSFHASILTHCKEHEVGQGHWDKPPTREIH
ncbi:hypothetical protein Cadr_000019125 [Camelus dromedarius]|uniref:Uncharacterized protein n=1 Tax=Camelus dromedarius TaxID=9838 RepID=A0A5N4D584_CAMDR|nr:hypothetical protein Cadr_000019125 [Camelus dromedarius]